MSYDGDHLIVTDGLGNILPPTTGKRERELERELIEEHLRNWSSSFVWFGAGAMLGTGVATTILIVVRMIIGHA